MKTNIQQNRLGNSTNVLFNVISLVLLLSLGRSEADVSVVTNTAQTVVSEAPKANNRIDIITLKGKNYKNCTVTRVEPDGITVTYAAGIVKIPFLELSDEQKNLFGYDPKRELDYKAEKNKQNKAAALVANAPVFKLLSQLTVGAYGRMNDKPIKIVQVIDDTSMLAEILVGEERSGQKVSSYNSGGQVVQVGESINYLQEHYTLVWFTGVKTRGLVDGQKTKLSGVYQVTGTKTYQLASGATRTVLILQPFNGK